MATSHAQIRQRRYVSGWCEAALHYRCKGSYAGTACSCSCHRQAIPEPLPAATTARSSASGR